MSGKFAANCDVIRQSVLIGDVTPDVDNVYNLVI